MEKEDSKEAQVVKDIKAFDVWYEENVASIMGKARELGLDVKLKPIMRMSWRQCSEFKNKEASSVTLYIEDLKKQITQGIEKSEQYRTEVERLTNKVISLEKAVKNIK